MTSEATPSPVAGVRSLSEYLSVIRRRKWVVILTTLLVPIVAFVLASRQADVYRSSADVLISRQDLGAALTGTPDADLYGDPARLAQTQADLARVPEVARRALVSAKIDDMTPGELLARSRVVPKADADILSFVVEHGDPQRAKRLATAYAGAFTDYKLELDTQTLARARKELDARLVTLRDNGAVGTVDYRNLVEKAEQLRTMELLQTKNSVIREATSAVLVGPTPMRNAMLGLMVGLLIGVAAAFIWDALDQRIRTDKEIEERLDIPLLARLPRPPGGGRDLGGPTMAADPTSFYAEAVRRLRANLEFANVDVDAKVVMLTSAVEQEGKSTTCANLAVALAMSGRRVALVDLDLRRPTLTTMFGLRGAPGVTDVSVGRTRLAQAIVSVPIHPRADQRSGSRRGSLARIEPPRGLAPPAGEGELLVLPSGALPTSPGEFVGTSAVARAITDLRELVDTVIVDVPPMLVVGDAQTISAAVDATIVVIRLGTVTRRDLADLQRELETSPSTKLGYVITNADADTASASGYRYYESRRNRALREEPGAQQQPQPLPQTASTPRPVEDARTPQRRPSAAARKR